MDLGELEATLEQFRSHQFELMSEEELTRQFIHLWLMKADRLVMIGVEAKIHGEGNDHEG